MLLQLSNRLAADLDLSYFSFSVNEASISYTNFALGANYYFFNEGRGVYGGLGFGRTSFGVSATASDPSNPSITGTADASVGINTVNLKIGGKHGGLFYFRWELGYGVALNDAIIEASTTLPNGYQYHESYSVPVSGGGLMANIGFGFSF
jgi:hypothetical protein